MSGAKVFAFRDMLQNYAPMKALFWGGAVGPWNDRAFGGSSVLADLIQQPFYLPNLLFRALRMPPWPGIAFYLYLHSLFALWAMWRLTRSSVAVAVFALGGFGLANLSNLQWCCAAAWVPAALLAFRAVAEGGRFTWLAWSLPQILLAGDPQLCALTGAAGLLLFTPRRRALVPALACAALIAAPQVFATLRALPGFERAAGLPAAVREQWSLHPLRVLELFVPRLFGPLFTAGFWGQFTVSPPWTRNYVHSIYAGVFCAPLALLGARRAPRVALAAALVLLVTMQGTHLYAALGALPGFSAFRYPQRLLALFMPLFAMLIAEGARALFALRRNALAPLAAGAAAAAVPWLLHAPHEAALRSLEQSLAFGALGALALLLPRGRALAFSGLLICDLVIANAELPGLLPRDDFARPPAACALLPPPGDYRVYVDQEPLAVSGPLGFEEQRLLEWNRGKRNLLEWCGYRQSVSLTSLEPAAELGLWHGVGPLKTLRLLGTRYVVTAPGHAARFEGREVARDARWGVALVELTGVTPLVEPAARVEREPWRIVVHEPRAGRLVLDETLDRDWRARVDGVPARIATVDSIRRAVEVPPGTREVVFEYRPFAQLAVFAGSLLLALALLVLRR